MRIVSVHGESFGGLRGSRLDLAPGLNVIWGPNESAKSTWHLAATTGLGGRRRGAGRTAADTAFEVRCRPWGSGDDGPWSLRIVLHLADGRNIELRRDLAVGTAEALDLDLGRPVPDLPSFDGAPDATGWLGLNRKSFPLIASVGQAEILRVHQNAAELRPLLQQAATASTGGRTAAEAIAALTDYRKEHVGTERINAVKPLRVALDAADRATSCLARVRAEHKSVEELLALQRNDRTLAVSAREREASALVRLAELSARSHEGRLREVEARQAELSSIPVVELSDVDGALSRRAARVIAQWDTIGVAPSVDGRSAIEIEADLAVIPDSTGYPTTSSPELERAEAAWGQARILIDEHRGRVVERPIEPDVDPDHVSRLAGDLRDHSGGVARDEEIIGTWVRGAGALGVAIAAASLMAALLVTPLAALGLLGAVFAVAYGAVRARRVGAELAARERDQACTRTTALAELEVLGLAGHDPDALVSAAAARHRAHQQLHDWAERDAELSSGLESTERAVRTTLAEAGLPTTSATPLAEVMDEHRRRTSAADRADREAGHRPLLEQELGLRLEAEARAAEFTTRLESVAAEMSSVATALGIDSTVDPSTIAATLSAHCDARRVSDIERDRAVEVQARLDVALGAMTHEELSRRALESRQDADDLGVGMEALDGVVLDEDDESEQLRQAREEAHQVELRLQHQEGVLSKIDPAAVDVAGAEAQLATAGHELERVRRLACTLDLTRRLLEGAEEHAYRSIAPVLADRVSGWLPKVTAGRYTEARLDAEDLTVRVRDAGGAWRRADQLSQGTAEQIFLLLRLALVEVVTASSEPCPVLLDEPTVYADDDRAHALLDVLVKLSSERQIVLFTQERRVADWADHVLLDERHRLVRLAPLS